MKILLKMILLLLLLLLAVLAFSQDQLLHSVTFMGGAHFTNTLHEYRYEDGYGDGGGIASVQYKLQSEEVYISFSARGFRLTVDTVRSWYFPIEIGVGMSTPNSLLNAGFVVGLTPKHGYENPYMGGIAELNLPLQKSSSYDTFFTTQIGVRRYVGPLDGVDLKTLWLYDILVGLKIQIPVQ